MIVFMFDVLLAKYNNWLLLAIYLLVFILVVYILAKYVNKFLCDDNQNNKSNRTHLLIKPNNKKSILVGSPKYSPHSPHDQDSNNNGSDNVSNGGANGGSNGGSKLIKSIKSIKFDKIARARIIPPENDIDLCEYQPKSLEIPLKEHDAEHNLKSAAYQKLLRNHTKLSHNTII